MESLSLVGASVEVAKDYTKHNHVFRIKLNNGGQFLFRTKDNDEMNLWIHRTQSQIVPMAADNKTKSLPPPDKQHRTTTAGTSGPGGVSASLKKDFKK
jgi:hypothetical protein